MKHWIRLLCLPLLAMVAGIASAQNVAKVGSTEFETLQAAFNAATDGETVTLLKDYNAANETMAGGTRQFVIKKSITFDGNGHTLTTKQKGIGIGNVLVKIDNVINCGVIHLSDNRKGITGLNFMNSLLLLILGNLVDSRAERYNFPR